MKILLTVIALIGVVGLLATGCIVGSGPMVDKDYQLTGFNRIEVSHDFQYDITRADTYKVAVSIHQNLVDHLDVGVSGQTLRVGLKPDAVANSDAKVTITLPSLTMLEVSGAAKGTVSGFSSTDSFTLQVSGAGQSNLDMQAGTTNIEVSGASRVEGSLKAADTRIVVTGASRCTLKGSAGQTRLEVSGASTADLPDLILQNADVSASGASTATVNTSGTLDVDISGASTLNYYDKPTMGKMNISGASKIHNK